MERIVAMPNQQPIDLALANANRALTTKREPLVSDLSSLKFHGADANHTAWELASVVAVGLVTVLFVVGLWFV